MAGHRGYLNHSRKLSQEEKDQLNQSVKEALEEERKLRQSMSDAGSKPPEPPVAKKALRAITTNKLALIVAAGIVILAALFVWPTLYRYDHIDFGPYRSFPVRANRLTGQTEILYPNGWRAAKEPEPKKGPAIEEEITGDDLAKLDIGASLEDSMSREGRWSAVRLNVYNGLSDVWVKEITIQVSVLSPDRKTVLAQRQYRISGYYPVSTQLEIAPLQSGVFGAPLGFDVTRDNSWSFSIVGAEGIKQLPPESGVFDKIKNIWKIMNTPIPPR